MLGFADDLAGIGLLGSSDPQKCATIAEDFATASGMQFGLTKCKVMVLGSTERKHAPTTEEKTVTMCGQRLDCVDKFVYLGVAFSTRKLQNSWIKKGSTRRLKHTGNCPTGLLTFNLGAHWSCCVACLVITSVWLPKFLCGCEVQQIDTARMTVMMARLADAGLAGKP
eukprot:jgi/Bigna1/141546/aug1.63_g16254